MAVRRAEIGVAAQRAVLESEVCAFVIHDDPGVGNQAVGRFVGIDNIDLAPFARLQVFYRVLGALGGEWNIFTIMLTSPLCPAD